MPSPHICPKCTDYRELTSRTVSGDDATLTFEVCGGCRGVWLAWDELGAAKALRDLLGLVPTAASFERDQRAGVCPDCDPARELTRLPVGAFAIDRCPECEGLWFDGGELGPMLTEQGFDALLHTLRTNP